MPRTAGNLPKHELIGLECKVIDCTDESKIGIRGEILDETKSMLRIEDQKVEKKNCVFRFTLPNGDDVKINGEILDKKPEERTSMKLD